MHLFDWRRIDLLMVGLGRGRSDCDVAEVTIGESESLDAALRRFNKRVQSEGILPAARRHEYYEKPSEKRKKKEAARRRKLRKSIIKAQKRREFF